jgi:hypothetical protein
MSNELFAAALGIETPWYVKGVAFDVDKRLLTMAIDFKKGSRFPYEGAEGLHPVHDTQAKRYRHLNFFQHECYLEVRTPRLKLPDGRVVLIEPGWAGKLSGFTLLFEVLILALSAARYRTTRYLSACAARCRLPPWPAWLARAGIGSRPSASAMWIWPSRRRTSPSSPCWPSMKRPAGAATTT